MKLTGCEGLEFSNGYTDFYQSIVFIVCLVASLFVNCVRETTRDGMGYVARDSQNRAGCPPRFMFLKV